MEGLCPYNRQRDVMLGHVRCVTISVNTTKPGVYKLKGGCNHHYYKRDTGQGLSL